MSRIRLLSEQVANQIAAGEVVERPASVVKELVENAIDAQATRIRVEVEAGGRNLIRVSDNGAGMDRDDALMSLERHATSKIESAADLMRLSTMGFRGEALPSISSVSQFQLTTRRQDDDSPEATQIVVRGGKMVEVRSAAGPPGTSIDVRRLFYNLPARRKFLRSEETERGHIQHYLGLAAMAHPEIGFVYLQNRKTIWQLPPIPLETRDPTKLAPLKKRLADLARHDPNMIPVVSDEVLSSLEGVVGGQEDPSERLTVRGFIGAPGVSRSTRADQNLFVNHRPIQNRGLNYALLEGYHTALMRGRYPICCLFLDLAPQWIDVNIHPAKREVRFRNEAAVRRAMVRAIRQALHDHHAASLPLARSAPSDPQAFSLPTPGAAGAPLPPRTARSRATPNEPGTAPDPNQGAGTPEDHSPGGGREFLTGTQAPEPSPESEMLFGNTSREAQESESSKSVPLLRIPLRMVGVVGRLYVVFESDRGMVLMDQHAAHERVLFEQMLHRLQQGTAPSQRLLLPETVELGARDCAFLRSLLPALERIGVGLSAFGEGTFLLDALPPFVKVGHPREFVIDLIDALKHAGDQVNTFRLGEEQVAKTVCRHAVKANDPLNDQEITRLLNDLRRCQMPYTCPHGRPTLIEMGFKDLEKKFGRIP